ncbi:MAG: HAMP domain-containing protein [Acidobacteria bacterium]|nr:HAMP domain-containing protein [Acidobacteriota bacterium]
MFDSMRSRLTFWYTGVLALVLVAFAAASYAYLARAARQRNDQLLADDARFLALNLAAEFEEDQTGDNAAREVARDFQFADRQAFVFDERGRVVASSDAPAGGRGRDGWPDDSELARSLAGFVEAARASGRAYTTADFGASSARAYVERTSIRGRNFFVAVAQSRRAQEEELARVRRAFYVAVPLALLLASLGGYFLARKSLAPVVEMGARAERIDAESLGSRLPVGNGRSELGRLALKFNELLARLDVSFEQQRRFMADASHELRTPVAIVCGESEVALSKEARAPEEYRESLAILHDEGRRLTRIVEDLFTLARADAGQYELAPVNFYLDEAAAECVRAVRSLAARRGVVVRHEEAGGEIQMRGDEALVRRMLLNLLDNAIKYTPAGGEVRVELAREGGLYAVRIADTGAGVPAEARAHIFERFYRADRARSRGGGAGGGAGLGLSIASWIAEAHGGRVALERSDKSGSTFLITLPASGATAGA